MAMVSPQNPHEIGVRGEILLQKGLAGSLSRFASFLAFAPNDSLTTLQFHSFTAYFEIEGIVPPSPSSEIR
jgi:hypothetical protein